MTGHVKHLFKLNGLNTSNYKIMTKEKQKLIDKYIGRIKTDYPENDKLIIDLQQFADEHIVIQQHEQLFCPYCGHKKEFKIYTDVNSGTVCKNRLCGAK